MTEGSALEELHYSIQKGLSSRGNGRDVSWIEEHNDELFKKYPDQFIAVINHKVIAHGDSSDFVKSELESLG